MAALLRWWVWRVHEALKLSGLTPAVQVAGTAAFLAPEQVVSFRACRPKVPEGLAGVIHRAPAKEPGERFADVRALRQALLDGVPGARSG